MTIGIQTDDPLISFRVQEAWSVNGVYPFSALISIISDFRFTNLFHITVLGIFLVLGIKYRKQLGAGLLLYILFSLIAFSSGGVLASSLRYVSVLWPFILIFMVEKINQNKILLLSVLMGIFQTLLMIFFVSGYTFAT
jgi:hypothetical protein